MTTLRQAAQQALEALEAITRSVQSDHQAEIAEDAIIALRTALEQPEQRPLVDLTDNDWGWVADRKGTSLDTFDQGAAWAQQRLKERNK